MKKVKALSAILIITFLCIPCFAKSNIDTLSPSPINMLKEQTFTLERALHTSAYLPVNIIMQQPELPNGCEITSLAMVLNYYGYNADKVDLFDNYLQHQELSTTESGAYLGYDPNVMYIGDAKSTKMGFYCFAAPITRAANLYLTLNSTAATASNISGASSGELERYLWRGQPIIVWTTIAFEPLRRGQLFSWTTPSGEVYHPYANLHCIVLKGFDSEKYYFSDPLYGEQAVEKEVFLKEYEALGSMAVVLGMPQGYSPLIKKTHTSYETVII